MVTMAWPVFAVTLVAASEDSQTGFVTDGTTYGNDIGAIYFENIFCSNI